MLDYVISVLVCGKFKRVRDHFIHQRFQFRLAQVFQHPLQYSTAVLMHSIGICPPHECIQHEIKLFPLEVLHTLLNHVVPILVFHQGQDVPFYFFN